MAQRIKKGDRVFVNSGKDSGKIGEVMKIQGLKAIVKDINVSKKPVEVRMGKGKGSPEYWACRVKPGKIMFEVDGVSYAVAKEAFGRAASKLPVKTKVVEQLVK